MNARSLVTRSVSTRRSALPSAAFLLLSLFGLFALSCGDFTLFGDDGSGPGPTPVTQNCDNAFPGLPSGTQADLDNDQYGEPLAVAVVPKGMAFTITGNISVAAGDLLVADRENGELYVRKFSPPTADQGTHTVLQNLNEPGGIALYHLEIEGDSGLVSVYDLLFYSETDGQQGVVTVQELRSGYSLQINSIVSLGLAAATSLTVGTSGDTVGLFIVGKDSSNIPKVLRVSVQIVSGLPVPSSVRTVLQGTTDYSYKDMDYFAGNGSLYVMATKGQILMTPQVLWIPNALSTSTTVTSPSVFIDSTNFSSQKLTGIAIAFRNQAGTEAYLLVMNREISNGQIQQFEAKTANTPVQGTYSPIQEANNLYPTAIAYDCTNSRLFVTNSPRTYVMGSTSTASLYTRDL